VIDVKITKPYKVNGQWRGWTDEYSDAMRAAGKVKLAPEPEEKPRRSAPRTARNSQARVLQRIQDAADERARRLADMTRGDQGIPVERGA